MENTIEAQAETPKTRLSYYEQLKHPLWQRRRQDILVRENYQCQDCLSTDKTLHVHHAYYEKGLSLWEYPDRSLYCLCEDCHKKHQDINSRLQRELGKLDLINGDIERILGYVTGLTRRGTSVKAISEQFCIGLGDVFHISSEDVLSATKPLHQIHGRKRTKHLQRNA